MSICSLCLKDKELVDSHIIPSFIIRWLKNASLTGFVRDINNSNRRIQDGYKLKLLCHGCEEILSNYETKFNLNVFKVFTEKYLDLNGKICNDGYISYEKWLNQFILSIVWRSFVSDFYTSYPGEISKDIFGKIRCLLETWRKYLLGESESYGDINNYILFLRNIHEGKGDLPEDISPKIIHYLMRTIDGALIYDDNTIIDMNKLGPIMTLTAIHPSKIVGYPDSIVKKSGKIKVQQIWSNGELNRYLFIDRPNEIDKRRAKTSRQQEQVDNAIQKNIDRINDTMTMHVLKSDIEKNA